MSLDRWKRIEEVFQADADLPASEPDEFVSKPTTGAPELKAEIEKLLTSLDDAESSSKEISLSLDSEKNGNDDYLGRQIGVYRPTKQVGRGGMGAVYQAERADGEFQQTDAVDRDE